MNIAVFGGTGGVGRFLVAQAIAAGHEVVVLARTPEKMDLTHERLRVVQGDGLDAEAVSQVVAGQQAVLCAVGGAGLSDSTTRSAVTKNILAAMQQHEVPILVVCSSLGAGDSLHHLSFLSRGIVKLMLRHAIADHSTQEKMIRASDCAWVIVRPPRLLDTEKTESYRVAEEQESFSASQVSRADVAHFMLKAVDDSSYHRKAISISM